MNRLLLLLGFFIWNPVAQAEVTLYACQKEGVAILQDKPIQECSDQKEYTYQSFDSEKQPATGLREQEIRQLQSINQRHQFNQDRYQHVDKSVGRALTVREYDRRQDLCVFYQGRIESTLISVDRRPVDHLEVRLARRSLERDHTQYQYYCGQKYPELEGYLGNLQFQHKPSEYRW